MIRAISILILCASVSPAALIVSNDTAVVFDASSYDVQTNHLVRDFLASHIHGYYPQFTNHVGSMSRSGAGTVNANTNQVQRWGLPQWALGTGPHIGIVLANDNGGMTSNETYSAFRDLLRAPPVFGDGSGFSALTGWAATNTIQWILPGRIPGDSSTGDSTAEAGNNAVTNICAISNLTLNIDLWHRLSQSWSNDNAANGGADLVFGPNTGGHPTSAGHLNMAIEILLGMGEDTNTSLAIVDWVGATANHTNHCSIPAIGRSAATLTWTQRFDRLPLAWDASAENAFLIKPAHSNAFNLLVVLTNAPIGDYQLSMDGESVGTYSKEQLTRLNFFTITNCALWRQRTEILGRQRDREGADRSALTDHSAGSTPAAGPDEVQFQSNAQARWAAGDRGDTLITALATYTDSLKVYDNAIAVAAQQTNHTFALTFLGGTAQVSGRVTFSGRVRLN